ncbi:MAG: DUF192 domain-containing protein [Candidatus Peribacteraceae bacterium]
MKYACIALAIIMIGCTVVRNRETIILRGQGNEQIHLTVEVADEPLEWQRGLMHREILESDGMLFVFPEEHIRSFWMKNVRIPLKVLFFDHRGVFVSSTFMQPCTAEPCPVYSSGRPAQFALEVREDDKKTLAVNQKWVLEWQ